MCEGWGHHPNQGPPLPSWSEWEEAWEEAFPRTLAGRVEALREAWCDLMRTMVEEVRRIFNRGSD